jgi:hypothetical protein
VAGAFGSTYDKTVIRKITVDEWNGQPRINIYVDSSMRIPSNLPTIAAHTEQALGVAVFSVPSLDQQLSCHQFSILDPAWNLEVAHPSNPHWAVPAVAGFNIARERSLSGVCNWSG